MIHVSSLRQPVPPDVPLPPGSTYIYRPRGRAREYAALAANLYNGCSHACAYCLTGDTLIYLADLRAVPISELRPGNVVLGVARTGEFAENSHKYVASVVEQVWITRKPVYEIELANGAIVRGSGDHRWLTERGWKYTTGEMGTSPDQRPYLTTNNSIRILGKPIITPNVTDDYRRGYLSGIIRGDGHLAIHGPRTNVYVRKNRGNKLYARTDVPYQFVLRLQDNEPLARARDYLLHFGLETKTFHFTRTMEGIRSSSARAFHAISRLIEWSESPEYLRGFLAGIYDAEGSHSGHAIRISNNDREILGYIERALKIHHFEYVYDVPHDAPGGLVHTIRIKGGVAGHIRFWQTTDPAISRKRSLVGSSLKGRSRIVRITDLGYEDTMYDIQTSSETFFANGLASHNCYAPRALYKPREAFAQADTRGPGFLRLLERDAARFSRAGIAGQVLLCFSCDPYQPLDEEMAITREAIQILHRHGLAVQILTKGGARAIRDIDLLDSGDAFATTLTLVDEAESLHWEPNAAPPSERILVLEAFHRAGIPTWVSLEPVIRPADSLELIRRTAAFTDLYRVGKMNHYRLPWPVDWRQFALDAVALLEELGKPYYLKADLATYLED